MTLRLLVIFVFYDWNINHNLVVYLKIFASERDNIVLLQNTLVRFFYVGLIEHLPSRTLENGI
jgi:hypothetical protein